MYETILLSEETIHDISMKTNRSEVDLMDELLTARSENRMLFITCLSEQGREQMLQLIENSSSILKENGWTPEEFVQLVKEDIERAHKSRVDSLLKVLNPAVVLLTEANLERYDLPTKMEMSRDDLMELIESDREKGRPRAVLIRDPYQWTKERERRRLESLDWDRR